MKRQASKVAGCELQVGIQLVRCDGESGQWVELTLRLSEYPVKGDDGKPLPQSRFGRRQTKTEKNLPASVTGQGLE